MEKYVGRIILDERVYMCEVEVARDEAIPSFDRVVACDFEVEEDEQEFAEVLKKEVLDMVGMFCDDVLNMERVYGEKRSYKALRKAVLKYFKLTSQMERYNRAVDEIICRCKGISKREIEGFVKDGKSFDEIVGKTAASLGCGSCEKVVRAMAGK